MYKGQELTNIKDDILQRIELGESINAICKEKGQPDKKTIYNWINKDKDFLHNYVRAKDRQAEYYANQIIDLVDNSGTTREEIEKVKVQVDARKWIASKLLPKKYGTNQNQTNVQVNIQPVTGMNIIDDTE